MANERFDPQMSSDKIWRGEDQERCITDDLDALEAGLSDKASGEHTHPEYAAASHTHSGYAAANHDHDGYAAENHGHTEYAPTEHEHSGYASIEHVHSDYADTEHTHSGYALAAHAHGQADIEGLISALAAKAEATHDHTLAQVVGLVAALAAKADLVDGKVPASQLPSYVSDIVNGTLVNATTFNNAAGTAVTPEADKLYNDTTTNKSYRWSGTQFVALNEGVALGETAATAYRGDRGKTAYDHSQNSTVHVTASQKTAWDGKAAGDHKHDALYAALNHLHGTTPVTTADEDIDTYTTPGVFSFAAAYAPINRPAGNTNGWLVVLPWSASSVTIKQIWIRHGTVNVNDHEIYVRTKTSSGWSTWAKIYTDKNPPTAAEVGAIAKGLQFTADNGGMEKTFYVADDTNLITELESLPIGFHTVYSQAAVEGNPNTTESFRCLLHKASSNIMWVLAFGTSGTIFSNYWNGGTWRGWREFYSDGHKPTAAEIGAISKDLQFTSDTGDVKENLSGQDVLAAIKAKAAGFYTFYTDSSTTNNPKATTGWRYLVHKTGANYAWVLAFGSEGSIYSNYLHGGSWVGWNVIYDAASATLWTGAKLMKSTETITPSKPLSKCRNGWIVEWSDYNNDSASAANTNFVQTPIYKRNVNGAWEGKNMMFPVPNYLSDDGATVSNAIKQLIVHDTKLVGHVANDKNTANLDVCIRAVYEF